MDNVKQINPIDLSKYIIKYMNSQGYEVNHLKLQKLIYYVDAWHYVFLETPIIKDDFQAWMHGPVVRSVWDYYKDSSILNAPISSNESINIENFINSEQVEVVNDVLGEYGNKTAYYLECLTHEETPWMIARKGFAPSDKCDRRISKEIMKEYYSEKIYLEK